MGWFDDDEPVNGGMAEWSEGDRFVAVVDRARPPLRLLLRNLQDSEILAQYHTLVRRGGLHGLQQVERRADYYEWPDDVRVGDEQEPGIAAGQRVEQFYDA